MANLRVIYSFLMTTVILLTPAAAAPSDTGSNWSSYRGGERQGTGPTLPLDRGLLKSTTVVESPIPGQGYSSPVQAEGKVFLTTAWLAPEGWVARAEMILHAVFLVLLLSVVLAPAMRRSGWSPDSIPGATLALLLPLAATFTYEAMRPVQVDRVLSVTFLTSLLATAIATTLTPARWWLRVPLALGAAVALWAVESIKSKDVHVPVDTYVRVGSTALIVPLILFTRTVWAPTGNSLLRLTPALALQFIAGASLLLMPFMGPRAFARAVVCFDEETGSQLWLREVARAPEPGLHKMNTAATPTVAADRDAVYAYFGNAGLYALDHKGAVRWSRTDLGGGDQFGAVVSPLLQNDVLILAGGTARQRYLEAIHRVTGKTQWRRLREPIGIDNGENRTPALYHHAEGPMVLVRDKHRVRGYFVADGREALELHLPARDIWGSMIAPDLVTEQHLVVPNEQGLMMLALNGAAGKPEVVAAESFEGADCSGPVRVGRHVISVAESGEVTAVDFHTGRVTGQVSLDAMVMAPLVAAGDLVLVSDSKGTVHTVRVSEAGGLQRLASDRIARSLGAAPAIFAQRLWIRTDTGLLQVRPNVTTSSTD